ncbi:hypothetical protein MMS97_27960, partial [Escherichia coli]|nr:hypothetical protein [Escherichia coli]
IHHIVSSSSRLPGQPGHFPEERSSFCRPLHRGFFPQWTFPMGDAHHVTGQLSGGRRKSF